VTHWRKIYLISITYSNGAKYLGMFRCVSKHDMFQSIRVLLIIVEYRTTNEREFINVEQKTKECRLGYINQLKCRTTNPMKYQLGVREQHHSVSPVFQRC